MRSHFLIRLNLKGNITYQNCPKHISVKKTNIEPKKALICLTFINMFQDSNSECLIYSAIKR